MKAATLWFAILVAVIPLSGCAPFAYGGIVVFGPATGGTASGGGTSNVAVNG
jgi:hypothetical protein